MRMMIRINKKFLMTYFSFRVCLTAIVLLLTTVCFSQFQPTPVVKSDQRILYQGKTFYIHTVKQGQTLYSICKAYGVTQQEIVMANPGVSLNPLAAGQVLKIPVKTETYTEQSGKEERPNEDEHFYYHKVQGSQNIYYLHKKYGVPVEAIYRCNPGSQNGIKSGDIIRIPKKELVTESVQPPQNQEETIKQYTVRQGDTLYRIAESYGVTESDLINANKELRWGLKPGQVIIIPRPDQVWSKMSGILRDSIVSVTQHKILSAEQCDSIASMKRIHPIIKIAILLPFFASESFVEDTISLSDTISENGVRNERLAFRGRAAVELYEGFLLAVDTLKYLNTTIDLFVYDTESDTIKVKKILKELEIIEPDLIFGPISGENVRIVSRFAFERKIPFVPPLAPEDSTLSYNPYLIRTIPSYKEEIREYTHYIAQQANKNIILIFKPGIQHQEQNIIFKKLLKEQMVQNGTYDSLNFHEVTLNDTVTKNVNSCLKPDIDNLVIVLSTYEPDVITVLANLHFMSREYSIELFGLPQWQRFDNVRIEVMHELQVTLFSPFFIDYSNSLVKSFILTCRNKLKYEPFKTTAKGTGINYTFLGYDLGRYFIEALNSYQSNLCDCLSYKDSKLLLSDYHYMFDSSLGYFVNKHITIIRYNKMYEMEVVKDY
jgi:LysM repeat protein/ABC-type branched-subunit amino acid transport system substrate-binding protein